MGDRSALDAVNSELIGQVIDWIRVSCEATIDRMKTSADPMPVVLVPEEVASFFLPN
ncbi:MAG: hypothetical protein R2849_13525 [Thermomicrobiales bacterium]